MQYSVYCILIVAPKEMLKGVSDDPYNGGPYVMCPKVTFF